MTSDFLHVSMLKANLNSTVQTEATEEDANELEDADIDTVQNIEVSHTVETADPPCCIAFSQRASIALVGMYDLVETGAVREGKAQQRRTGSVELVRLTEHGDRFYIERPTKLRYTTHFLNTSFGILDLKVVPESDLTTSFTGQGTSDRELFAAATSAGFISLFTVHYRPPTIIQDEIQYWESLSYFCSLWVDDANEIITQICWSSTQDGKVAFTTASGAVKVLQLPQPNKTTLPETGSGAWTRLSIDSDGVWTYDLRSHVQEIHVHSLEAWACAITSPSTIVSGGDDACLAWSSIPNKSVIDTSSSVPIVDRRIHQAGVTAVLPVHRDSDDPQWPQPLFLITGSYDDHIRILTVPNAETGQLRPRVLAEANLGGGVWRLKLLSLRVPGTINGEEKPDGTVDWVKYDRYEVELAVCCMYAGARIVRLTGPTLDAPWNVETIAKFTVHQSMCYGLDVLPGGWLEPNKGKEGYVFLSCSFYDKQLCVWKWVPKPK